MNNAFGAQAQKSWLDLKSSALEECSQTEITHPIVPVHRAAGITQPLIMPAVVF